ncbi:Protein involved in UDP-galactose transport to the Golgi lumen [Komagataella phaffii CBS 7435]|uniref:UDP-galactose transporter homolog 1 n=2 Tax=Komagataella phaffii TaxID=460519 RepID=C4R1G5_KOMPG|nr:Protein with a role in UDP-galactose transport to the Golgi lumen [Komagataella phaffii GS115]AOA62259.1 GQ67_00757T0 [Komagataella phaffii]CAH2448131.1 Protein involved in UDP-galactose transport to the Golgi lumen [Komagataella phaffii CBS 7435]AOA68088.1 GQ68_00632T0 [Komagataella phaffii GS115]CAY69339.1 Protein with a role in UDP-galactose transport to the Golgi lumen [Komagataella phaffii GS115]CCA38276.1 Protein involved in UDP-galactose transport to the Golgi lumen [Komagataella pha
MKTLTLCVAGIYASFILWGYLQERLSEPYNGRPFKAPLIVNAIQSFFAMIVGSIYLSAKTRKLSTPMDPISQNPKIIYQLALIAVLSSGSSAVGMKSLENVDYLTYLLAKSCKLIPVMIVSVLVYRKRFPVHKYCIALCISAGVILFTLKPKSLSNSIDSSAGNWRGYLCLLISLFLDGLLNSSQDQLFKTFKISGAQLMAALNMLTFILISSYIVLFTDQLPYFVSFVQVSPQLLQNAILYGIAGAIGQIFIFLTLEKFDSIVLTTVTVTRKMFSMVLSVLLFGHSLSLQQQVGIGLVFGGICYESWLKSFGSQVSPKAKLS